MISKALRGFGPPEKSKIKKLLSKVYYAVIYPVTRPVKGFFYKLGRAYDYAKFSWDSPDWDSAYLFNLMAFKLKRIKIALIEGIAIQEDKDMAALDEAIAICERLFADNYDDIYYKMHNEKWGEPNYFTEAGFFKIHRKNVITEEDELNERADIREIWIYSARDKKIDFQRLGKILIKHSAAWWE